MTGFVYIWRDRKYKRYYVGSHWGPEDDGYVCSSTWMKNSFKRRPQDFKRRILARVISSRSDLLIEENKWLTKIKQEEIGKRYYNLTRSIKNHWHQYEDQRLTVGQKISKARLNMSEEKRKSYFGHNMKQYVTDSMREKCRIARSKQIITDEHRRKISESNMGKVVSEETRAKISNAQIGRKASDETRLKMSLSQRGKKKKPMSQSAKEKLRLINLGKKHSEESKAKVSAYWLGRKRGPMSEATKEKLRQSSRSYHAGK